MAPSKIIRSSVARSRKFNTNTCSFYKVIPVKKQSEFISIIEDKKYETRTPALFPSCRKEICERLGFATSLSPTKEDNEILCMYFKKIPKFLDCSSMLDDIGSGHDKDLDDRRDLLQRFVQKYPHITTILTMDGHGRLVARIIKACPTIQIQVCDISESAHEWHQTLFPTGISSHLGDIIEMINESIKDRSIENKLIYLNFCGIGKQSKNVMTCMKNIINYDKQYNTQCIKQFVISFSKSPRKDHLAIKLRNEIQKLCKEFTEQTTRTDFITLAYGEHK